jgi:hypothetical protein
MYNQRYQFVLYIAEVAAYYYYIFDIFFHLEF